MELSIYKFLTLKAKKQPRSIELGANWLTIHWTINAWQVTVRPRLDLDREGISLIGNASLLEEREDFLYLSIGPRLGRCNRSTVTLDREDISLNWERLLEEREGFLHLSTKPRSRRSNQSTYTLTQLASASISSPFYGLKTYLFLVFLLLTLRQGL